MEILHFRQIFTLMDIAFKKKRMYILISQFLLYFINLLDMLGLALYLIIYLK